MISPKGHVPESWCCIDCGINTAPSYLNREQMEQAFAGDLTDQGIPQTYSEWTEVYSVKNAVWKAAGMEPLGGCLCIGCLEKRLGRMLTPSDFRRKDPLNHTIGTERLLARRGDEHVIGSPMTKMMPDTIKVKFEVTDNDMFVVVDGVKIARRGYPDTLQAKTWVSLEPGWEVIDGENFETISIRYRGVNVH